MKIKNILWLALAVFFAGVFTSCKKIEYDYIDGKTPDERSAEFSNQVRQTLLNAENGWVGYMYIPANKRGYTFYMQFKEHNRVIMYSDFTDVAMTEPKESSYSIRNTGMPSLIFDTYSYIHLPADPNSSTSGGATGVGLSSDFEYAVIKVTDDSIILRGNLKNCDLTLVKINSAELALVKEGKIATQIDEVVRFFNEKQNNYVEVSEGKLGVNLTHGSRQISYQILKSDGSVSSFSGTFFYSVNGLQLRDFVFGNIHFVEAKMRDGKLYLIDKSGKEYEMLQNRNPLTPLAASFKYGDTYKMIHIEGQTLPAGVNSGWNKIYNDLVGRFNKSSGRVILYMDFVLQNSTKARVIIRYQAANNGSQFTADAEYDYVIDGDVITLSNYVPSISNSNWNTRVNEIGEIVDYFKNRSFKIDWAEGTGQDVLGGLYPVDKPTDFYFGILMK